MTAPGWSYVKRRLSLGLVVAVITQAALAVGQPNPPTSTPDGAVFVNVLIQKRELYVGESVPVTIQVGALDDVVASLDSPPSLHGDAFTLNVLKGEPEREQRVIDGKPCTLLAWHSLLTAVKPGTFSLTIEAPFTVRVPLAQPPVVTYADEAAADPYSDPGFQGLLQTTTPQAVVASSRIMTFIVLALPTENRPPGFSGAIGTFNISSELSKDRSIVGEPVSLRLHVQGAGNFDRVNTAMLEDAADRRAYRATSQFAPAEPTGYRGEKVFEQAVVATQPGTRVLPALEFSYFDPQARRYEIVRAAPQSLDVAPGPAAAPVAASTATTDAAPDALRGAVARLARGDHPPAPAPDADSLIPLYLQPRYLGVPVLLIVGFAGVWFKRGQRAPTTPGRSPASLRESSTAELLLQMERAATRGDSAQFFRSASHALRAAGVIEHDAEAREILRLVDEADYAGEVPQGADLQRCHGIVIRCLAARGAGSLSGHST